MFEGIMRNISYNEKGIKQRKSHHTHDAECPVFRG